MFTTHQRSTVSHQALLLGIAALLGLYCSLLFGAEAPHAERTRYDGPHDLDPCPGPLPSDVDRIAQPITRSASLTATWRGTIAAYRKGRLQDALAGWRRLEIAGEYEVWRDLSLGAAHLYLGELDAAAAHLRVARQTDHENPVVHYFIGLLRREQATTVADNRNAADGSAVRLANHAPHGNWLMLPGETRNRLLREAINEFELAIRFAPEFDPSQRLVAKAVDQPAAVLGVSGITAPNVGDLLETLGADNFTGKSHGLLAHLYLDRGHPDAAEHHVDQAEQQGIPVPHGYRKVGRMYEAQGRAVDAARAYQKAVARGDELAKPGSTVAEDMRVGFEALFSSQSNTEGEEVQSVEPAVPGWTASPLWKSRRRDAPAAQPLAKSEHRARSASAFVKIPTT